MPEPLILRGLLTMATFDGHLNKKSFSLVFGGETPRTLESTRLASKERDLDPDKFTNIICGRVYTPWGQALCLSFINFYKKLLKSLNKWIIEEVSLRLNCDHYIGKYFFYFEMIPKFWKADIQNRRKSHKTKSTGLVVFVSVSLRYRADGPALDYLADGFHLEERVYT